MTSATETILNQVWNLKAKQLKEVAAILKLDKKGTVVVLANRIQEAVQTNGADGIELKLAWIRKASKYIKDETNCDMKRF